MNLEQFESCSFKFVSNCTPSKAETPSVTDGETDDSFDLSENQGFQMKTVDGTSSIKIIKKVEDENFGKKSSVSSSVPSEPDSERKISSDSVSSPPMLEELDPPVMSPLSDNPSSSSSGRQSPKVEEKVEVKPKPVQKTVQRPAGKPRGRPPGSKNVEKRRLEDASSSIVEKPKVNGIPAKRAKQQPARPVVRTPTAPKSRKTKDPTVTSVVTKPVIKHGSYKGPPPSNYEKPYENYQQQPRQRPPGYRPSGPSSPYVYATPSSAPIRPAAPPAPASPISPKVMPTFDPPQEDDDAPLDLTVPSKRRQSGSIKSPPPEPKKPPPQQRVQNQPLNLKRIQNGKVLATVKFNPSKMKTPSPVKRDPGPARPRQGPVPYRPPPQKEHRPVAEKRPPVQEKRPMPKPVPNQSPKPPSPVKKAPVKPPQPISQAPQQRPPQKLKSINMAGRNVVSVANVKCQKRPPPPPKPTPPKEAKPSRPKPPPKNQPAETPNTEDKTILVHRGKTLEQRLDMEFAGNKEVKSPPKKNEDKEEGTVIPQSEEDKQLADDTAQYAPRTVSLFQSFQTFLFSKKLT